MFEGPFDLLVYLIESARMDIYDIKVAEITDQYLEYMEQMDQVHIENAAEFMVLAANLIDIKSKMLLPKISPAGETVVDEDPRTDLVERILEYRKFRAASEIFREMETYGEMIMEKPKEDMSEYEDDPDEVLMLDIGMFMKAFNDFLNRKKKVTEIRKNYENVQKKKITSEDRVRFIRALFEKQPDRKWSFTDTLNDSSDRYDIALSFTSVMEMVKQREVKAEQKIMYGEITLEKGDGFDRNSEEEEDADGGK